MLKMVWLFFNIFLLCFLGLTGAGQETNIQFLNLYDTTSGVFEGMSKSDHAFAVSASVEDLIEISRSVLKAESWLRTHVLSQFPATRITTIVVGNTLLCQNGQNHNWVLVLPSLKNVYYSLTRWGLEKEIKVSAAFSSSCFNIKSDLFRDDFVERVTEPLLQFLHSINSTYSINPSPNFSALLDETVSLVSSCTEFLKKFGSFHFNKINIMETNPKQKISINRKLSSIESPNGFSVPSNVAKNPHPSSPIVASPPFSYPIASPPPMVFPFAPEQQEQPPFSSGPALAPYGYSLPPCNPISTIVPAAPGPAEVVQELWCVAKPSVPAETLQEAMDYACGKGGADCAEILPQGNCFYPDTVFAHASYAFNSYFQKTKRNGGSCSFGGTAMLITSDPSFLHCRFILS
ncbi:hypothetical protein JCGZ_12527 [Jatropha curcas]|uniref:glucan endo-1,3-beta-D-glucosidase n=1 Tax=Jatropha curcas TaxID=180498 RepID=A0A067K745_JATCU|nr:glucan endo-1,3-beta-glucosidase 12 [Jatropha curcas]XP_012079396.1 glucan endo-1,3-beta-glucosidase 12 [Jatropha curcas]KDP32066.1 hypothetical protein JCGZ_12527 [Jatropha curcas]